MSGNNTKVYTGTFINNKLSVVVTWIQDGRKATYTGSVANGVATVTFVIDAVGTQGGVVGDNGVNSGPFVMLPPINPGEERSYSISKGKTLWLQYLGKPVSTSWII